jgi:hypothetical protein
MNDPTSLEEIEKHLPSKEEAYKTVEEFAELGPTTNRAGARGIKSGLGVPAIRPRGLKKASDFVDKYSPGKLQKPRPKSFSEYIPEAPVNPIKKELKEKLRMILPRNFCPDCGRTDRPSEGGAINTNFFTEDTEGLGLKAFDIFISFFCQECLLKITAKSNDPIDQLIIDPSLGATNADMKAAQRLIRIKENTHAFIKAKLASGDHSIYVTGKRDD